MLENALLETAIQGQEKNSGQREQSRKESRRKERGKINSPFFASGTTTGNTCLVLAAFFLCLFFLEAAVCHGQLKNHCLRNAAENKLHV